MNHLLYAKALTSRQWEYWILLLPETDFDGGQQFEGAVAVVGNRRGCVPYRTQDPEAITRAISSLGLQIGNPPPEFPDAMYLFPLNNERMAQMVFIMNYGGCGAMN